MNISGSNSNAYSALNSTNKGFSGLVSGMDTEALVQKMLSGQQTKIDKQKANKQIAEWKQTLYRDVITKINGFQNKFLDFTSKTNLASNSFYNQMTATSTSKAFKINGATSDAISGEMRIKIDQLASSTKLEGGVLTDVGGVKGNFNAAGLDPTVSFNLDAVMKPKLDVDGNPVLDVDGKPIIETVSEAATFTLSKDQIKDIMDGKEVVVEVPKKAAEPNGDKETIKFTVKDGVVSAETDRTISVVAEDGKGGKSSAMGLDMLGLSVGRKSGIAIDGKPIFISGKLNKDAKATLDITLDGTRHTLTIDPTETKDTLQKKLDFAFGNGTVKLEGAADLSDFKMTVSEGRRLVIDGNNAAMEATGLKRGQSTTIGSGDTLENVFGITSEKFEIEINGKKIELLKTDTIADLKAKIDKSGADVELKYDDFQNKFVLSRQSSGKGFDITFGADSENLLNKMFGATDQTAPPSDLLNGPGYQQGQNAMIEINGIKTERSSNNFTVGGINIELLDKTTETELISTSRDSTAIFDGIKSFVEDYNKLIKELNGLLESKPENKDYPPLTDAQRKEMSQGEIDAWEKKAQVGLLRGDDDISSFLSQMRVALYEKPQGATLALFDIGIETDKDVEKRGELIIDEAKLKEMLNSDPAAIQELFTFSKTKEVTNLDGTKSIVPDGPQGIATAFKNIIKATANTSSGSPGKLVQVAGYANTGTDKKNALYDQMKTANDRITTLTFQYEKQKARYWNQFNTMEKVLANLSSQSSWLTQQMGGQ